MTAKDVEHANQKNMGFMVELKKYIELWENHCLGNETYRGKMGDYVTNWKIVLDELTILFTPMSRKLQLNFWPSTNIYTMTNANMFNTIQEDMTSENDSRGTGRSLSAF